MKTKIFNATTFFKALAILIAIIFAFTPLSIINKDSNNDSSINMCVVEAKSIAGALSSASARSGKSTMYISKWNINPAKCNITVCMNTDKEIDAMLKALESLSLVTNTCEANKIIKKANNLIKLRNVIASILTAKIFTTLKVKLTLVLADDFSSNSCQTYNKLTKAYNKLKKMKTQYPNSGLKITFSDSEYKVELQ